MTVEDSLRDAIGGNSAEQLRAYVRRIERIEGEVDDLNADKSEVYAETKAAGFDKRTLRKLVVRRRKDRTDVIEEDELLEMYEAAMVAADERDPFE